MDKRVETHIEQQTTQTIALQNAPSNWFKRSCKVFRYDRSMKVLVKANYQLLDFIWDVVIIQNSLYQPMMYLTKSVLKVKECNYK